MRAEDIKDAESLQAWLESLPQETEAERETARRWAATIAHRAAMRVLPVFREFFDEPNEKRWNQTWIMVFRPSIIAMVGSISLLKGQTRLAKSAASGSAIAHELDGWFTADCALNSAVFSVRAIYVLEEIPTALKAIEYANYAADIGEGLETTQLWGAIRADCLSLEDHQALQKLPLWQNEPQFVSLLGKEAEIHQCDGRRLALLGRMV